MISASEKQTKEIAVQFVEKYKNQLEQKCLIFALKGDLGTGKTIFAKGVAEALGIKKVIRSPSFIIQREFPYNLDGIGGNFVHIDLWRMESGREVEKLRIEKVIKPKNVVLIEWVERMGMTLRKLTDSDNIVIVSVKISHLEGTSRKIEIEIE